MNFHSQKLDPAEKPKQQPPLYGVRRSGGFPPSFDRQHFPEQEQRRIVTWLYGFVSGVGVTLALCTIPVLVAVFLV